MSLGNTIIPQKTMTTISHLRHKTEPTPQKKRSVSNTEKKQELTLSLIAFNKTLGKFHEQVKNKEKGIKILKKYNNMRNQYISTLPEDLGEKTRQSVEEDQEILNICEEE